ncbi:MAG: hypothetical protein Q7S95_01160 [bacterium]|nr:hypothetical protein [bacterium]
MTQMSLHYLHLMSTALAFVAFAVSIAAYVRLPSTFGTPILAWGTTIIAGWAFLFAIPVIPSITADDQLGTATVVLFMTFVFIFVALGALDRVRAPAPRDPDAPRGIKPPPHLTRGHGHSAG